MQQASTEIKGTMNTILYGLNVKWIHCAYNTLLTVKALLSSEHNTAPYKLRRTLLRHREHFV